MFSSVCHCNPKIYFLFSYCYWLINILVTSFTEYGHMIWILFSFNTVSMHGCARAATFLPWLCQHLLPLTQPSYLSCYPSLILSCLPTSQSHDLKHFHFFFFFLPFGCLILRLVLLLKSWNSISFLDIIGDKMLNKYSLYYESMTNAKLNGPNCMHGFGQWSLIESVL